MALHDAIPCNIKKKTKKVKKKEKKKSSHTYLTRI